MTNRICALDGCEKKLPPRARADGDPFCSAECCRAFHGVEWSRPSETEGEREPTKRELLRREIDRRSRERARRAAYVEREKREAA